MDDKEREIIGYRCQHLSIWIGGSGRLTEPPKAYCGCEMQPRYRQKPIEITSEVVWSGSAVSVGSYPSTFTTTTHPYLSLPEEPDANG